MKEKKNIKREKFEVKNAGDFQLIYPVKDPQLMEKYQQYSEMA